MSNTEHRIVVTVRGWAPVVLWMALMYFFSDQPDLDAPLSFGSDADYIIRKAVHFGEYAVLGYLLLRAMRGRFADRRDAIAIVCIVSLAYAFMDEWHQTFISGRSGNIRDVAIDFLGVLCALFIFRNSKR